MDSLFFCDLQLISHAKFLICIIFFFFYPDSEETAKKEIEFFFPGFNINKWKDDVGQFLRENGKVTFDEKRCEHVPER